MGEAARGRPGRWALTRSWPVVVLAALAAQLLLPGSGAAAISWKT